MLSPGVAWGLGNSSFSHLSGTQEGKHMEQDRHFWRDFLFYSIPRLESQLSVGFVQYSLLHQKCLLHTQFRGSPSFLLSKAAFSVKAWGGWVWEGIWERSCLLYFVWVPAILSRPGVFLFQEVLSTQFEACFVFSLLFLYLGAMLGSSAWWQPLSFATCVSFLQTCVFCFNKVEIKFLTKKQTSKILWTPESGHFWSLSKWGHFLLKIYFFTTLYTHKMFFDQSPPTYLL